MYSVTMREAMLLVERATVGFGTGIALEATTLVMAFIVLLWFKRLPSIQSLQGLADLLNTKGGIVMLLTLLSITFFAAGMRMMYWAVNMQLDGKLTTDNALIISAFNFCTGTAFGGSFAALLKTMTGEEPSKKAPAGEEVPPVPKS
jgi:hypothetical protein